MLLSKFVAWTAVMRVKSTTVVLKTTYDIITNGWLVEQFVQQYFIN
jgi:hypothetical protein